MNLSYKDYKNETKVQLDDLMRKLESKKSLCSDLWQKNQVLTGIVDEQKWRRENKALNMSQYS